jgi:hypothetical protein
MIHVDQQKEPADFDRKCRKRGAAWIQSHQPPIPRPDGKSYWGHFHEDVEAEFHSRCGYYAMYIHDGEIDHFIPWDQSPQLGFEWNNFRFIDSRLNKKKLARTLLDPFIVQNDWFEIEIPSLELKITSVLTDPSLRQSAENTVEWLKLRNGRRVLQMRARAYEDYRRYRDMDKLEMMAPLVARAVSDWLASYPGGELPDCSRLLSPHLRHP